MPGLAVSDFGGGVAATRSGADAGAGTRDLTGNGDDGKIFSVGRAIADDHL